MRTRKELLKFFLEKLGLWSAFEREVNAGMDLPSWDNTDDNLNRLFEALKLLPPDDPCYRVANRLTDKTYLDQLVNNEDLSSLDLVYGLSDLCKYAGLDSQEPRVWDYLPEQSSIMEIVEKVHDVANA